MRSREEALQWARRFPNPMARPPRRIEARPLYEMARNYQEGRPRRRRFRKLGTLERHDHPARSKQHPAPDLRILPIRDLERSKAFFAALGFAFNPQFTNEQGACMVINEGSSYAMLLVEPFFQGFTKKPVADARKSTEVLIALSCDSREEVDEMVRKALAAGGTAPMRRRTTASCTPTASTTSTATCGKCSGWIPRLRRRTPEAGEGRRLHALVHP